MMKIIYSQLAIRKMLLTLAVIIFLGSTAYAQKDETCLACHEDQSMTMSKNGKEVKIGVKKMILAKSVHGKVNCVQCHVGFDPDNIQHKAKIEPPDCMTCHKNAVQIHLFHPQMVKTQGVGGSPDVKCKGCHGSHNVESTKTPTSKFFFTKLTETCGNCHKKEKALHMQSQHYFELNKNNPDVPTCMFCHKNPITAGAKLDQAKLKVNQEKLCLKCHLNNPSSTSKFAKSLVNY